MANGQDSKKDNQDQEGCQTYDHIEKSFVHHR